MTSVTSDNDNIKGNGDRTAIENSSPTTGNVSLGETGNCGEGNGGKVLENPPTKPVNSNEELDDFGLPIRPRKSTPSLRPTSTEVSAPRSPDGTNTPSHSEARKPMARSVSAPLETLEKRTNEFANKEPMSSIDNGKAGPIPLETKEGSLPTIPDKAEQDKSNVSKLAHDAHTKDISEWSHQKIATKDVSDEEKEDDTWHDMPALGEFDVYDDYGRIVARGAKDEDEDAAYQGLGGAGKGYTRVQIDEDAQSATSLDENT
ncbi:hypothetical protein FQN49_002308, partial [Arthroderma sp. PD_2]